MRRSVASIGALTAAAIAAPYHAPAAPDGGRGLECPPDATLEGEPCLFGTGEEDHFNSGCTMGGPFPPPDPFTPMSCGETICGEGYFDGQIRDTDWIELLWDGDPGLITLSVVAEFNVTLFRPVHCGPWFLNCECFDFSCFLAQPHEEARVRHFASSSPGGSWYFIAESFVTIVDCDDTGSRWIATATCEPPSVCNLDIDGEPGMGFGDLLVLLAGWGQFNQCGPSDLNGDSHVDLDDLLLVLAYWGPCE